MKLSIAIATFNEEKNIIRCLKSIYDWVNEIIVVDGKSSDKTVDLIKKFDQRKKIKIYLEDNPPMFHINKQKAIERCTKDWILQLDADEVISKDLRQEIAILLNGYIADKTKRQKNNLTMKQFNNETIAFWIPRLNFFLGKPLKKGGQYPDYSIRLYRNGAARFPCKSVHEQVTIKFQIPNSKFQTNSKSQIKNSKQFENWNLKIGHLKAPLLHYPYPTFSEYLNKWNRYTSLEAQNLKKQGFKPSFWNFIKYFLILPHLWFFKTYIRHLGFLDGFPGFVFSLFSAIRYWGIYIKTTEK